MKTVCFLVKFELPDTARPNSEPDVLAGSLGFIIEQKAKHLFNAAGRVTVYHVPCLFNQPGALNCTTRHELRLAAQEGGL